MMYHSSLTSYALWCSTAPISRGLWEFFKNPKLFFKLFFTFSFRTWKMLKKLKNVKKVEIFRKCWKNVKKCQKSWKMSKKLTYRHFDILTFWHINILTYWHFDISTFFHIYILTYWHIDILTYLHFDIFTFWHIDILTYWHFDI